MQAAPPAMAPVFEGVSFAGDLTELVAEQLARGIHRGREDGAPGDWLDRALQALPGADRPRLAAAIHEALTHANPEVRVGAIRLLDGNPRIADPERLLDLVERRWDLFAGLQDPSDPPSTNRACALVQLVAGRATGPRGSRFRQTWACDPVYGICVLAALAEDEPEWVAEHIHELVTPELDPTGARLEVLMHNLERRPKAVARAVANLASRQPALRSQLTQAIRATVRGAARQKRLLRRLA